ncbi:autotransporter-associated beta strand repeat-containing protein [Labrys neptuniae]
MHGTKEKQLLRNLRRHRPDVHGLLGQAALAFFLPLTVGCGPVLADPVRIPLQHVKSSFSEDRYDTLGIVIGINGQKPHLFEFDTGSDLFNAQIDADVDGVEPLPGSSPEMYGYGNGNYGAWIQRVTFKSMAFYNPDELAKPVTTLTGEFVAGHILNYVYTKDYPYFGERNMSSSPILHYRDIPLYADLDIQTRVEKGEPGETPPFYGVFGAADYISKKVMYSALGGSTPSGYVISANANIDGKETPGCAPCLTLNLTPSVRAQFTALMPWGKLDYSQSRALFPGSNANASSNYEGFYKYSITAKVGSKTRTVNLSGPVSFDTGTSQFLWLQQDKVLHKLRENGIKLAERSSTNVAFKFRGFPSALDNLEFNDVELYRRRSESEGDGIVIGMPFFQTNSLMYDLENKATAYSPFFVSAENFTTAEPDGDRAALNRVTSDTGSRGWLGVAGSISGDGDFSIEKDAVVRMTGANTYTGATRVASDGFLYLAGPGSIETSASVVVDGVFSIAEKGNYLKEWGVSDDRDDAVIRSLTGSGEVRLGSHRLVLAAADGEFSGTIMDRGKDGKNGGGSVRIDTGRFVLSGHNEYTGPTEIGPGAELRISGYVVGDVAVSGVLVVDGEVGGNVIVKNGARLSGSGKVGNLTLEEGGHAELAQTQASRPPTP